MKQIRIIEPIHHKHSSQQQHKHGSHSQSPVTICWYVNGKLSWFLIESKTVQSALGKFEDQSLKNWSLPHNFITLKAKQTNLVSINFIREVSWLTSNQCEVSEVRQRAAARVNENSESTGWTAEENEQKDATKLFRASERHQDGCQELWVQAASILHAGSQSHGPALI